MNSHRPANPADRRAHGGTLRLERAATVPRRPPRRVPAIELFRGEREIVIPHGPDDYRLRITSNGKLILTK